MATGLLEWVETAEEVGVGMTVKVRTDGGQEAKREYRESGKASSLKRRGVGKPVATFRNQFPKDFPYRGFFTHEHRKQS